MTRKEGSGCASSSTNFWRGLPRRGSQSGVLCRWRSGRCWERGNDVAQSAARPPNGSGIVNDLISLGFQARSECSLSPSILADWIVTNPPYMRDVVDQIVWGAVRLLEWYQTEGAAFLMRSNWDLAAKRSNLFSHPLYRGQVRMRFRPWWSEERKAQPIHHYVWHIWAQGKDEPVIRYWPK